ncbi:shikimate dehydrogenase [Sphingomonas rosea]|uniref:shikimate dehydrogenase family protein n=1 Tax=Sphingomonas rosea TaxID=335605 RepID=UPI0031D89281
MPYAEVIGDPVGHSKSPLIHNFWLAKLGITGVYRTCHVAPEELQAYLEHRREDPVWTGCNLTIPHKIAALALVDEIDQSAADIGAANCIVPKNGKLVAFNTDGSGVDAAIPGVHNSVCIIGAGGAARAAIPTLDVMCALDIRVVARDPIKARHALSSLPYDLAFYPFAEAAEAMRNVDGIINASPLGMTGQWPMPDNILAALETVAPDAYVFDMVYSPLKTGLLQKAEAIGLTAVDGLIMLVGQAGGAFKLFFGEPAPREHDAELRGLLTA